MLYPSLAFRNTNNLGKLGGIIQKYTPYVAVSLEKITGINTNNIRVRESGTSTEQEFTSTNGTLDEAGIATFCGVDSGFVPAWRDRLGTNDLVQATASRQPRIYNGSAIDTESGKSALYFDGGDWLTYTNATPINVGTPLAFFLEASTGSVAGSREFVISIGGGGLDNMFFEFGNPGRAGITNGAAYYASIGLAPPLNTLVKVVGLFDGVDKLKLFRGGIQTASTTVTDLGFTASSVRIGARIDSFAPLTGFIRSGVVWKGTVPSDDELKDLTL